MYTTIKLEYNFKNYNFHGLLIYKFHSFCDKIFVDPGFFLLRIEMEMEMGECYIFITDFIIVHVKAYCTPDDKILLRVKE